MLIASAITNRQLLTFTYDGFARTVEPHAYGLDRKGHPALLAYQVSGGSRSGHPVGWKLFHRDGMQSLSVLPETFSGPRAGYNCPNPLFISIRAKL